MLEDTPLEPQPTPEEIEQQQQDDEFARRVRREVKRIQSGEADSDIKQDEEAEKEKTAKVEAGKRAKREAKERAQRRRANMFWQIISGNILLRESVSKYYMQMVLIAVLFFVSIFVMFWSLHLDMRYSQLAKTVQLSRERSIRLQEMKYLRCSHSAISNELERRGIDLSDPTRPATIIND